MWNILLILLIFVIIICWKPLQNYFMALGGKGGNKKGVMTPSKDIIQIDKLVISADPRTKNNFINLHDYKVPKNIKISLLEKELRESQNAAIELEELKKSLSRDISLSGTKIEKSFKELGSEITIDTAIYQLFNKSANLGYNNVTEIVQSLYDNPKTMYTDITNTELKILKQVIAQYEKNINFIGEIINTLKDKAPEEFITSWKTYIDKYNNSILKFNDIKDILENFEKQDEKNKSSITDVMAAITYYKYILGLDIFKPKNLSVNELKDRKQLYIKIIDLQNEFYDKLKNSKIGIQFNSIIKKTNALIKNSKAYDKHKKTFPDIKLYTDTKNPLIEEKKEEEEEEKEEIGEKNIKVYKNILENLEMLNNEINNMSNSYKIEIKPIKFQFAEESDYKKAHINFINESNKIVDLVDNLGVINKNLNIFVKTETDKLEKMMITYKELDEKTKAMQQKIDKLTSDLELVNLKDKFLSDYYNENHLELKTIVDKTLGMDIDIIKSIKGDNNIENWIKAEINKIDEMLKKKNTNYNDFRDNRNKYENDEKFKDENELYERLSKVYSNTDIINVLVKRKQIDEIYAKLKNIDTADGFKQFVLDTKNFYGSSETFWSNLEKKRNKDALDTQLLNIRYDMISNGTWSDPKEDIVEKIYNSRKTKGYVQVTDGELSFIKMMFDNHYINVKNIETNTNTIPVPNIVQSFVSEENNGLLIEISNKKIKAKSIESYYYYTMSQINAAAQSYGKLNVFLFLPSYNSELSKIGNNKSHFANLNIELLSFNKYEGFEKIMGNPKDTLLELLNGATDEKFQKYLTNYVKKNKRRIHLFDYYGGRYVFKPKYENQKERLKIAIDYIDNKIDKSTIKKKFWEILYAAYIMAFTTNDYIIICPNNICFRMRLMQKFIRKSETKTIYNKDIVEIMHSANFEKIYDKDAVEEAVSRLKRLTEYYTKCIRTCVSEDKKIKSEENLEQVNDILKNSEKEDLVSNYNEFIKKQKNPKEVKIKLKIIPKTESEIPLETEEKKRPVTEREKLELNYEEGKRILNSGVLRQNIAEKKLIKLEKIMDKFKKNKISSDDALLKIKALIPSNIKVDESGPYDLELYRQTRTQFDILKEVSSEKEHRKIKFDILEKIKKWEKLMDKGKITGEKLKKEVNEFAEKNKLLDSINAIIKRREEPEPEATLEEEKEEEKEEEEEEEEKKEHKKKKKRN